MKFSQIINTTTLNQLVETSLDLTRQQVNRMLQDRLCIGITGLSRSGKSTFITSLITQLLNYDKAQLGGFTPAVQGRIMGVKIHPLEESHLPLFPYQQAISELTATPPRWPSSTRDLSGCLLEIKLRNRRSRFKAGSRRLFIELRDYPGEWLLDLPLMQMNYSEWCAHNATLFAQQPRLQLLGDLYDKLQQLNPIDPHNEAVTQQLTGDYSDFLQRCKEGDNTLSQLQPGRFLINGHATDNALLQFLPLINTPTRTPKQLEKSSRESYYRVYEARYNSYVDRVVRPFYKRYFSDINRQVVLVDLINAVNGGAPYMDDMVQALTNISDCYAYGENSLLASLFKFHMKIDKVIYVASKADQVISKDHEALRHLLGDTVNRALKNAAYEGVHPALEVIAAVRSSHEVKHQGEMAITGRDCQGTNIGYINPQIPHHIPATRAEYEHLAAWKIPRLSPPAGVNLNAGESLPHIRMDTLLEQLLGDWLNE
ncbi:MAG: YcjX family protein [Gammaproteobacteria bacterium]|nr:YcjX family protein [Gammaproteobacteria bacterium]